MGGRTIQPIKLGDQTIYVEVSEVEEQGRAMGGPDDIEYVDALEKVKEAGDRVRETIEAWCMTVQSAVDRANPDEWSLEINLGFKGKAGIPFITEGEANGAVKVTAKWKQSGDGNAGRNKAGE